MTVEEFQEQVDFAARAMSTIIIQNSVKVLVKVGNKSIVLNVKEIGFNDKEGMLYIEASE